MTHASSIRWSRLAGSVATALAVLLFAVGARADAAGVDFAVSPSRLVFAAMPGVTTEQTVTVYNTGADPLDLRLSIGDFLIDDRSVRATTFAVAEWVRTREPVIEILPGEQADVTVILDVPAGAAPGGYQAGLFIVSVPDRSDPVAVAGRIGVAVLIELPPEGRPLRRELQVTDQDLIVEFPTDLSLASLFAPNATTRTHVANLGETFVRALAVDRYRWWTNPEPLEATAPGTTILRGTEATFTTSAGPLPWFGPASVTTEVVYQRGAQDFGTIVVQVDTFVIPWRLLGLVGLLGVLALVAWRRRRRRRLTRVDA
jgi:hypothetical protein